MLICALWSTFMTWDHAPLIWASIYLWMSICPHLLMMCNKVYGKALNVYNTKIPIIDCTSLWTALVIITHLFITSVYSHNPTYLEKECNYYMVYRCTFQITNEFSSNNIFFYLFSNLILILCLFISIQIETLLHYWYLKKIVYESVAKGDTMTFVQNSSNSRTTNAVINCNIVNFLFLLRGFSAKHLQIIQNIN